MPDDVRASILVCSSWPVERTAALIGAFERELGGAGLAVAMFDDLLPSRSNRDPLSPFDTAVLAARLIGATDALLSDARLRDLPVGYLGIGGAADAAVIAASERRQQVGAVVLVDTRLIAASTSLRCLEAPTLLVLSRAWPEDSAFLVTGELGKRQIRVSSGAGFAGALPPGPTGRDARRWFQRHLVRVEG